MKKSIYFSDKLHMQILPAYTATFQSAKAKHNCVSFFASICDYCKKDFLDINAVLAQSYFNYLFLPRQDGSRRLASSTIELRYSSCHAFSNYLIRNASAFGISYFVNPFDLVQIKRTDKYLDFSKVPDSAQINEILHRCEKEPVLYAAVSLIIKCGFTVSELTSLRQDSFILDENDQAAVVLTHRNIQRCVKIPEDVLAVLDYYWNHQTMNTEYLFENKAGHPMRVRDLERLYKKCMGSAFQFTLSDLRNGCIAMLCACGVPAKKIGAYTGIRQYSWLHRYDKIIPELSLAPCDYSNLYIKIPFSTANQQQPDGRPKK